MTAAENLMNPEEPGVLNERHENEQMGGPGTPQDQIDSSSKVVQPIGQPKPIYKTFGRDFHSVEDLTEYTKEMERQVVESRMAAERLNIQKPNQTLQNPNGPAPKADEGPQVEDLLFTDPKKAIIMLKQQAKDDVMKDLNAKDAERKFWETFYAEYSDLRNVERIVQSVTKEKWSEVAYLPLADAKKFIAGESRKLIEQIRGTGGTRVELSKTSASSLPASGGNPPAVVAAQGEPETFVAQLKKFQRRTKH